MTATDRDAAPAAAEGADQPPEFVAFDAAWRRISTYDVTMETAMRAMFRAGAEWAARPAPAAAPREGELEALRALLDAGPSGSDQFDCAYCELKPGRTKHARDCVWAAAREAARGEGG